MIGWLLIITIIVIAAWPEKKEPDKCERCTHKNKAVTPYVYKNQNNNMVMEKYVSGGGGKHE